MSYTPGPWYKANSSSHQGLIIPSPTGSVAKIYVDHCFALDITIAEAFKL